MIEEVTALVIDTGYGVCKVKFAGDEAPKSVITSVVDRLKVLIIMI